MDGNHSEMKDLLPLLLSAPKLEEVKLGKFSMSMADVETLTVLLSEEAIFKHVTKVDFGSCYAREVSKEKLLRAMEKLSTRILSFSPQLQTFQFNFDSLTEMEDYKIDPNSTFAHCLALFKKI